MAEETDITRRRKALLVVDKFLQMALDKDNVQQASRALQNVHSALSIAKRLEPKSSLESESVLVFDSFLAAITGAILRSEAFRIYHELCQVLGMETPKKSDFFYALQLNKFEIKQTSGEIFIVPPATRGRVSPEQVRQNLLELLPLDKSIGGN